jgi:hypothetical protein
MQKIPLTLAQPGMVLEKPVTRQNGMVLVGPGTPLSESLINRLENMDIEFIVVQGHPVEMEGQADTAPSARIERLDHLFRAFADDAWMMQVKTAVAAYWSSKAAEDETPAAQTGQDGEGA